MVNEHLSYTRIRVICTRDVTEMTAAIVTRATQAQMAVMSMTRTLASAEKDGLDWLQPRDVVLDLKHIIANSGITLYEFPRVFRDLFRDATARAGSKPDSPDNFPFLVKGLKWSINATFEALAKA